MADISRRRSPTQKPIVALVTPFALDPESKVAQLYLTELAARGEIELLIPSGISQGDVVVVTPGRSARRGNEVSGPVEVRASSGTTVPRHAEVIEARSHKGFIEKVNLRARENHQDVFVIFGTGVGKTKATPKVGSLKVDIGGDAYVTIPSGALRGLSFDIDAPIFPEVPGTSPSGKRNGRAKRKSDKIKAVIFPHLDPSSLATGDESQADREVGILSGEKLFYPAGQKYLRPQAHDLARQIMNSIKSYSAKDAGKNKPPRRGWPVRFSESGNAVEVFVESNGRQSSVFISAKKFEEYLRDALLWKGRRVFVELNDDGTRSADYEGPSIEPVKAPANYRHSTVGKVALTDESALVDRLKIVLGRHRHYVSTPEELVAQKEATSGLPPITRQ